MPTAASNALVSIALHRLHRVYCDVQIQCAADIELLFQAFSKTTSLDMLQLAILRALQHHSCSDGMHCRVLTRA